VSTASRHTEFLAARLRAIGLELEPFRPGDTSVTGALSLSPAPFPTLTRPVRVATARFYSLGHARLKFFEPAAFFRLRPLEVAGCSVGEAIERALRRDWGAHIEELRQALEWLGGIAARTRIGDHGSRLELELPGPQEIRVEVVSRDRLLLPTAGPLRDVALRRPEQRCFRPPREIDGAIELELTIVQALERLARARAARRPVSSHPRSELADDVERPLPPALVVMADRAERALAETALRGRGLSVKATGSPQRALAALHERTFAAAILDTHLPRTDGLELALRLSEVPGIESLPVLLIDDRPSERIRGLATSAGAAGYLIRPVSWDTIAETVLDLVSHWSKRRYERFGARLGVAVETAGTERADVAEQVGRGGMLLRSRRELEPGALERYAIWLPSHGPVRVEGEVVYREESPGSALLRAGIRFVRFLNQSEARWIEAVRALAGEGS
jgi:CheY-like chemotaxis protein